METPPSESALDFITALSVDDCISTLKRNARRAPDQWLRVRADGRRVWVESAGQNGHHRKALPMWLFRFEGNLTPTPSGTRVHGTMVLNSRVESWLVIMGLATVVFGVLGAGFTISEPDEGLFVLMLAVPFVLLFALFYAHYRLLLKRQKRALSQWVYEWLTVPQGHASKSI